MGNFAQGVCPTCGKLFTITAESATSDLACTNCGKKISIMRHTSVRLQAVTGGGIAPSVVVNSSPAFSGVMESVQGNGAGKTSVLAPAVGLPPAQVEPFVPDRPDAPEVPMVASAWAACQTNGLKCQAWPGINGFTAEGTVAETRAGTVALCATIYGSGGVLLMEAVAAPLPKPPLLPLRELLSRINVRSGGTVFRIRETGVIARYRLWPRARRFGNVSRDAVMRGLTQLAYDIACAQVLLKHGDVRMALASPQGIDKAFAVPLAAAAGTPGLRELEVFAKQTG